MGGRGAKVFDSKNNKGRNNIFKSNSNSNLPTSTEKLSKIQISLRKKKFKHYQKLREHWKQIGSNATINYDKSDKRVTKTQGANYVTRLSRWRQQTYFRDFKPNNKSAISIEHGTIKKRWSKHFNENHNAK